LIETLQARYGFTVMPFTATIPVPGLFGSAAHKEAVARLRWLISARGLGMLTTTRNQPPRTASVARL